MKPEEYRRLIDIFELVRELPESERAAAIDGACAGHTGLREQVLRLLAADAGAGDHLLDRPAIEDVASLLVPLTPPLPASGTIFGNFRLDRRIGAGGMGVVYEGYDLPLQRRVAIKLLKSHPALDSAEWVQRFQREARAVSLLNHPNIVSILHAGFDGGFYYIVTEFIEGSTLRQLLAAQPMGLDGLKVLDVVSQAASALRATHEAGIVHRDLKPENIMVRPDGIVKVLDFGLAKLAESPAGTRQSGPNLLSQPGDLAGTIHYLSPEQVLGKPVDPRSDLFSLGVVAYELGSGVRPFDGPTDGAIYDAVLNGAPAAPSSIRTLLGPEFDDIVLRLMEKQPELRYQTAGDLRSSVLRLMRTVSQPRLLPAQIPARRPSRATKAAVAGVIAVTAVMAGWYVSRTLIVGAGVTVPVRFERLTNSPGDENSPGLSPDGKQFVYAAAPSGKWDIYLQRTGGSTPVNLTRASGADDSEPALSPDGSRIVFYSSRDGGGLFVMELTGENPARISREGHLPSWSPDGRHVVYSGDTFITPVARGAPSSRLSVVDLSDGSQRKLETGDAVQPSWSPHAHRIAYWGITSGGRRDIFTVAASGSGRAEPVTSDDAIDWSPIWSPAGDYLYFLSNRGGTRNIWRVAIDERSGRLKGAPEPITVPAEAVESLSVGKDGKTLLYSQASQHNTLTRIGFDPVSRVTIGVEEAVAPGIPISNLSFSPDGAWIVFDTVGEASEELWIMNRDGAQRRRLVSDAHRNRAPQWSPDGKEILFLSDRSGQYGIWSIRIDGSGVRPLTTPTTPNMQKAVWSPDGTVVFAARSPEQPVVLYPQAPHPASNPEIVPGLLNAGRVLFDGWAPNAQAGLLLAELQDSPDPELGIYSFSDARLERTGVRGRWAVWLSDPRDKAANNRYFVFDRESEVLLYDRGLKRETRVFSSAPSHIYCLALPPDRRKIYFTGVIRDSDLWMAHLDH